MSNAGISNAGISNAGISNAGIIFYPVFGLLLIQILCLA